ncbi:MarR family winged helix-turn-helix transcriptional regulator [Leucobacter komagatae]|uniref:HTH-type transcriptional regulator MgrA n=1 Tax=Leucobacter komagatae TaxID=55969 RepID=A0A0D0HVL0_9MICO|nr:MarR family transcriptional regulator [Leucobacter komagatae]KIP51631.1 hypothetical protein SD72_14125 [Leucobacter komagatae]
MDDTGSQQEPVAIADRLSFQLYAASRAVVGAYRRKLQEFDLTYPQYLAMHALWTNDGQTVTELCSALELDSGTVSPLLTRLEAVGYLLRERVGADGRQVRVFCTELGRELQEKTLPVPVDVASSSGLSDAEYGQLCGLLSTLRAAVRSA